MTDFFSDSSIKKINLALSGGGMAGMYHGGVCKHLLEMYRRKKLDIIHVYGTSAGAFVGAFFIYHMVNPNANVDDFLNTFHTVFKNECKMGNFRILPVWRKLCDMILPDDIHVSCSGKLHVAVMMKDQRGIRQKVISQYNSKNELIDILSMSGFIPLLTGLSPCATYICPVTKYSYPVVDGIFTPPIENTQYETLYINLNKHRYPLIKRLFYFEKPMNNLIEEGYKNSNDFFYHKKEIPTLYLYEQGYNKKHKKYLYLWTNKLLWLLIYTWFTIIT